MPKVTLTQAIIDNYKCSDGLKKVDLFDTKTPGLVLEVRITGGKTYYLRYQNKRKRTRLFKLANARDVTIQQARALCQAARTKIALGQDPREDENEARLIPTLARFAEEYYLPWAKQAKRSWSTDLSILNNHILPALGQRYMDEITREDVSRLHLKPLQNGAAPSTANRVLIITRHMFNLALNKWEIPGLDTNPAARIRALEENNKRERFLSQPEMVRLIEAVQDSPCIILKYLLPVLLHTGARRNEALMAQWDHIDFENRSWVIPQSKSGKKRYITLSEGVISILMDIKASGLSDTWVFPNPKTGSPYQNIYTSWHRARVAAGLPDVRMHDLRHTFASLLVNHGRSLYEVQKILGHSQIRTTERYAHLDQETLLDAVNTATQTIPFRGTPVELNGPRASDLGAE